MRTPGGGRGGEESMSGPGRAWLARWCLGAVAVALAWPVASSAETPPYQLPVSVPAAKQSPLVDANAPYTPVVLDLIHQLEPSSPPTRAEIANASKLLH